MLVLRSGELLSPGKHALSCRHLQPEPIQLPVLSTGTRRGEKQLRPGGILGSWWGITAETFKTIQNVQSDLKRIHS